MKKWTVKRQEASNADTGSRLDHFIAENNPDISRTQAKKIIDLGGVHINGRRIRSCSHSLKCHDFVELYLDHQPLDPWRINATDIVYQDQYLIVLNKPAMIDTQPTHARYKGTLYEALQWYLKNPQRPHLKPELGMIQRLDRGTSGLIVFSIHPRAHKKMTQIFLDHLVQKRYLALVEHSLEPPAGEHISQLARSRQANRVKSVAKGGKQAITRYRTLEQLPGASLLEVDLITGRSHQIRAHMSELGCPLLGDSLYGGPEQLAGLSIERPLLHAAKLAFLHPVADNQLEFSLPLPTDMQMVLARLKGAE